MVYQGQPASLSIGTPAVIILWCHRVVNVLTIILLHYINEYEEYHIYQLCVKLVSWEWAFMFHFGSAEPLAQSQRSRNVIQTPAVKETAPTDHATTRTDVDDIRSKSLYRRHCIDCHDPDGRSVSARDIVSRAPDFTDPQWHRAHGDFELAHTIWEGKKPMPAMKRELAMTDVDGLVLLVRRFRGGKLEISEEPHPKEEKDKRKTPPPPVQKSSCRLGLQSGPPRRHPARTRSARMRLSYSGLGLPSKGFVSAVTESAETDPR